MTAVVESPRESVEVAPAESIAAPMVPVALDVPAASEAGVALEGEGAGTDADGESRQGRGRRDRQRPGRGERGDRADRGERRPRQAGADDRAEGDLKALPPMKGKRGIALTSRCHRG